MQDGKMQIATCKLQNEAEKAGGTGQQPRARPGPSICTLQFAFCILQLPVSVARQFLSRPRHAFLLLTTLLLAAFTAYLGGRQLWAWHHSRAARRALEGRDYRQARAHLADCLAVWPDSAATHFLAARAARLLAATTSDRREYLDEAMEHLDACERLGGSVEDVALEWDLIRAQQGRLAAVEKKLLACVRQDHPDWLYVVDVLTWQWLREHRLVPAKVYLDLWVKRRPDDREALVRRGWVAEHLLDIDGALRDYGRALNADPERDRAEEDRVRLRLAEILVRRKRGKEALPHLEILSERQPANPAVVLALARCRHQLGQTEEARRLLDALLDRRPDDGQTLGERGRLALDTGHAAEAEPWLRRAAAHCPHDRHILYNLARCLNQRGHREEAKRLFRREVEIRADEKLMARLIHNVLKTPGDAELRCRVGQIFLRNGFTADGVRWLNTALACDPRHRAAHHALAEHYEKASQAELAARHRSVARELAAKGQPRAEQGP